VDLLRREIVTDRLMRDTFKVRLVKLQQQEEHLDVASVHQENIYVDLLEKVSRWQSAVELEKMAQNKQQQVLIEAMHVRYEKMVQHQQYVKTCALVIPVALQGARKELRDYFQEPSHGKKYIQALMSAIQRVYRET